MICCRANAADGTRKAATGAASAENKNAQRDLLFRCQRALPFVRTARCSAVCWCCAARSPFQVDQARTQRLCCPVPKFGPAHGPMPRQQTLVGPSPAPRRRSGACSTLTCKLCQIRRAHTQTPRIRHLQFAFLPRREPTSMPVVLFDRLSSIREPPQAAKRLASRALLRPPSRALLRPPLNRMEPRRLHAGQLGMPFQFFLCMHFQFFFGFFLFPFSPCLVTTPYPLDSSMGSLLHLAPTSFAPHCDRQEWLVGRSCEMTDYDFHGFDEAVRTRSCPGRKWRSWSRRAILEQAGPSKVSPTRCSPTV